MLVRELNLELPDDFDGEGYSEIYNYIIEKLPTNNEFAQAWVAVAYRYKTIAECDNLFVQQIHQFGDSPEQPARFNQERELFNFFVNSLSVFESFCYGGYSLASILNAGSFPMKDERDRKRISYERTSRLFNNVFPNEKLTVRLNNLLISTEFKEIEIVRNILAHRVTRGRNFNVPGPTLWIDGIVINKSTTTSRRNWLSNQLKHLFADLNDFVKANFI